MRPMLSVAICAAALAGCDADPPPSNAVEEPRASATADPERSIAASFDCGRARGQAQELVCGDANLAAMDREVARLSSLAMEPAAQAEWVQQRDSCAKADLLRECVMAAAALKIHRLRKGSDVARTGEGLSVGPIALTCRGVGGPVLATFVNSDPGAVALEWSGQALAIDRVIAASGARYEGRWDGESYSFWNKGKEATLTVPGKGDLQCVETPPAG